MAHLLIRLEDDLLVGLLEQPDRVLTLMAMRVSNVRKSFLLGGILISRLLMVVLNLECIRTQTSL